MDKRVFADVIKDLWVAYVYTCTCVHVWWVDPNLCPHACPVGSLLTEPSPQPVVMDFEMGNS